MTGYEVGDDLLVQILFAVDAVKDALKVIELLERRFAHQLQDMVAGVLGSHLQPAADMVQNELTRVFHSGPVGRIVIAPVKQEVVADATADEAFLYTRQRIHGMVNFQQF